MQTSELRVLSNKLLRRTAFTAAARVTCKSFRKCQLGFYVKVFQTFHQHRFYKSYRSHWELCLQSVCLHQARSTKQDSFGSLNCRCNSHNQFPAISCSICSPFQQETTSLPPLSIFHQIRLMIYLSPSGRGTRQGGGPQRSSRIIHIGTRTNSRSVCVTFHQEVEGCTHRGDVLGDVQQCQLLISCTFVHMHTNTYNVFSRQNVVQRRPFLSIQRKIGCRVCPENGNKAMKGMEQKSYGEQPREQVQS